MRCLCPLIERAAAVWPASQELEAGGYPAHAFAAATGFFQHPATASSLLGAPHDAPPHIANPAAPHSTPGLELPSDPWLCAPTSSGGGGARLCPLWPHYALAASLHRRGATSHAHIPDPVSRCARPLRHWPSNRERRFGHRHPSRGAGQLVRRCSHREAAGPRRRRHRLGDRRPIAVAPAPRHRTPSPNTGGLRDRPRRPAPRPRPAGRPRAAPARFHVRRRRPAGRADQLQRWRGSRGRPVRPRPGRQPHGAVRGGASREAVQPQPVAAAAAPARGRRAPARPLLVLPRWPAGRGAAGLPGEHGGPWRRARG
jgi:hypothetical protein